MNLLGRRQKQLPRFLTADAERETLEYLLQGMREVLGDETPEENVVRTYLQESDRPATLRMERQMVAMDKLLECAEVNLRMLCDLIRCQQLKVKEKITAHLSDFDRQLAASPTNTEVIPGR